MTAAKNRYLFALVAVLVLWAGGQAFADVPAQLQPVGFGFAGINSLEKIAPNLTGAGIDIALISRSFTYIDGEPQNDYQPNLGHNCFADANVTLYHKPHTPPGVSAHSTAVCSILFGSDPNARDGTLGQFQYRGAAPAVNAHIYEFWYFLINHLFPSQPCQADIITAAIGNQYPDWWTWGFQSLAQHHNKIVIAGIGNGTDSYDPQLYPAAGANVIAVGVIDSVDNPQLETSLRNFTLPSPRRSSAGPTGTGTCKPDIVAPGNFLAANSGDSNSYEPTGNYSSYSTPLVAGTVALLTQAAKSDPNLHQALYSPLANCVMKSILLNSASKLPFWHKGKLTKNDDIRRPLDFTQGAGMLNALAAYRQLTAGPAQSGYVPAAGWDSNSINPDTKLESSYIFDLPDPAGKTITATLCWNNHFQPGYPFEPLKEQDYNLRLELWGIDTTNGRNNILFDYSDSPVDNLEHIHIPADANFTRYEIIVTYSEMPGLGRSHPYALAWRATPGQNIQSFWRYDLNGDGIVDNADSDVLIDNIRLNSAGQGEYLIGDINDDGLLNDADLMLLNEQINRCSGPAF